MSTVITPDNDSYIAMEASPNSAVNLEWFLSEVLGKTVSTSPDRKELYQKINTEVGKKTSLDQSLFISHLITNQSSQKKWMGFFMALMHPTMLLTL